MVSAGEANAFRYVQVGQSAPHLLLEDLTGRAVKSSFAGKLIVLVFWKTGQSFSSQALGDLSDIAKELQRYEIEVYAISGPETTRDNMRAMAAKYPLVRFFIDPGMQAHEAYGVIVLPSTGIVGKDGKLAFYHPSRNNNYKAIISGKLKVLLGLMAQDAFEAELIRLGETFTSSAQEAQNHYRAGLTFFHDGKQEKAVGEFTRAISIDPTMLEAYTQLGYVLLEMGNPKAAIEKFEHVKQHNPLSPAAGVGLGIAYLRVGEWDKGRRLLESAVAINPNPVQGYIELAKAYEAKGDLTKALYYYKRAVKKVLQGRK